MQALLWNTLLLSFLLLLKLVCIDINSAMASSLTLTSFCLYIYISFVYHVYCFFSYRFCCMFVLHIFCEFFSIDACIATTQCFSYFLGSFCAFAIEVFFEVNIYYKIAILSTSFFFCKLSSFYFFCELYISSYFVWIFLSSCFCELYVKFNFHYFPLLFSSPFYWNSFVEMTIMEFHHWLVFLHVFLFITPSYYFFGVCKFWKWFMLMWKVCIWWRFFWRFYITNKGWA